MTRNLVLYGFMGSGKTSVAGEVSRRTGMRWVDTDALVEQKTGKSVARIFAQSGEASFRSLEREAVETAARLEGAVISTGGGVPLDPDLVCWLDATGVGILLTAEPGEISRRLKGTDRPVLAGQTDEITIRRVLEQRREAYDRIRHRVSTDGREIGEVVDEVLAVYHTVLSGQDPAQRDREATR